jgi:hypothetical protein
MVLGLVTLAGCAAPSAAYRFLDDQEKSGAFGTGSWTGDVTPGLGAAGNYRLLHGNHQEISGKFPALHSAAPALALNLLKIKESRI